MSNRSPEVEDKVMLKGGRAGAGGNLDSYHPLYDLSL